MAVQFDFDPGEYTDAVKFFKEKLNLPTKKWNDIEGAMHTRAFTVAGAMKEDILVDFRNAVDDALTNGRTLQQFQEDFNRIAGRWAKTDEKFAGKMEKEGYAAWRAKTIYATNMKTAYTAARERQVRDPDLQGVFTHAKYVCMFLPGSREQHKHWSGTVLPVNHPWWKKHSPPNGWGCQCEKQYISKYEIDSGFESTTNAPTSPESTAGIDQGWDYSIGTADTGSKWPSETKEVSQIIKSNDLAGWREAPQSGLWKAGKEETANSLPVITNKKFAHDNTITQSNIKDRLKKLLGVKDNIVNIPFEDQGTGFGYNMRMDIDSFLEHIKGKHREAYLPMFAKTLLDPASIRVNFLKSTITGKSAIRTAYWNKFEYDGKIYVIKIIGDSGCLNNFTVWTGFPTTYKAKLDGVSIYEKPL
jgi:uncharacterized protein with gpF-like domain